MPKRTHIEPIFVDSIPTSLEEGKLYISERYRTAMHRCCCGCGLEVVTPLNPAKWELFDDEGKVSLFPSIGNWSFPCQSHYWIDENEICWSRAMPRWQIERIRHQDRLASKLFEVTSAPAAPTGAERTEDGVHVNAAAPDTEPAGGWWSNLVRWIRGI